MADFSQKKMQKIIENVSNSIRYCKISFLVHLGSSSLSNIRAFFDPPSSILKTTKYYNKYFNRVIIRQIKFDYYSASTFAAMAFRTGKHVLVT